jgi:DNA-binding CsgD family transcriptional regulator
MSDAPHDQVALAALLYADDQLEEARAQLESAFVGLRDAGDPRTAAIVAGRLGELHAGSLGNEAVGRGWIARGRELLEQVGPCVEWGYWELARLACDRPDLDELTASTERALAIARDFGDVGLEARALADSGLALVSRGRMREGFVRLDQALAMLTAGEVGDPYVIGTSLCSLLSSCDRAGDVERAMESIRLVETMLLQPFDGRPRVLGTHCKLAFGSVLCAAGRWSEGEAALLDAIGPDASKSRGHRVEAQSRLAELRVHQGRVDEAAELLATIEDSVAAAGPLALVHLRRGRPELAAAVLRSAVKRMVNDVLRGAPLLSLLVEAEIARGDVRAAHEASTLLDSMAAVVDAPIVPALAALARGRVERARGDTGASVRELERALEVLGDEHPLIGASVLLELAGAHEAAGDAGAAVVAARGAHAAATRLQATTLVDRAASVLRSLGATSPRAAPARDALGGLTARELDVLAGIQRGDSNAQIAAALFVSPKTVEHHVGRILGKLGVRTRAEAAAVAARSGGAN